MQSLSFPNYSFRIKNKENKTLIFDVVRKNFMVLTPEEWVRQHVLQFLLKEQQIPLSHINVEKQLTVHQTKKRYDIVVFNKDGSIYLIVECKAPHIAISQNTFDQIARYNLVTQAEYLMITNGLSHYFCQLDNENERYIFLENLPKRSSNESF